MSVSLGTFLQLISQYILRNQQVSNYNNVMKWLSDKNENVKIILRIMIKIEILQILFTKICSTKIKLLM